MPWPTKGESKEHYISRAIPEIMKDKGKDSKQAAGQAYGMWDEKEPASERKQEKFVAMAHVRPKYAKSAFLMSLYVNPTSDEMKKYVAIGARGYLCANGDLYLEGYEDEKKTTNILHGPVLELMKKTNSKIFGDTDIDTIWSKVTPYGFCVQRYENTGTIYLGELLDSGGYIEEMESLISPAIALAQGKNPRLKFELKSVPYGDVNSKLSGFYNPKLAAKLTRKPRPKKPKPIVSPETLPVIKPKVKAQKAQSAFEEKFVTMDRTIPYSGGASVLMSIYLNPTQDEIKNFIANGARGYLCANGDLYIEGYEKEAGGSKVKSSVVHGAFLKSLQRFNPELIKSIPDAWENTTRGITIQRWNSTNKIYAGQSVYLYNRGAQARVLRMLAKAQKKNPDFEFINDLVDNNSRSLPGKWIPDLARDLEPPKKPRVPKPKPQPRIYNKFKQGVFEEKFVTMGKDWGTLFSIYKNPARDELRYAPEGARGWISPEGDLYLESYEKEHRPKYSQITHTSILEVLNKDGIIKDDAVSISCFNTRYGITVQRAGASLDFYIGESVAKDIFKDKKKELARLCALAKKRNPNLDFYPLSIYDAPPPSLKEKFVTMAHAIIPAHVMGGRPKTILFSIYKNPNSDETRRFIAAGARGFITTNGDTYLEGYEDPDARAQRSQVVHGAILEVLRDMGVLRDVEGAWTSLIGGVSVQRYGETNKIFLGESLKGEMMADLSQEEYDKLVTNVLARAQAKNLKFIFSEKSILSEPDSGQYDADYLAKYGTLAESFVTMARYRPRSGGSVLLSIYKNPDPDEMKRYIANGARGFISEAGDLYMEGYEDEAGGSEMLSSIMHDVLLQVLQDYDPDLVPDVDSSWNSELGNGVTVQRWGHSNDIYIGESVDPLEALGEETADHIRMLFGIAGEKNSQLQFFPKHIYNKETGRGATNLSGRGRLTGIDDERSEDEIEMDESAIREGINLDHAYPTRHGRYDSADTPHYDFETETGIMYRAMFNVENIYVRDYSSKSMSVLFGTAVIDDDGNEEFSYERVNVGPRIMYRVLATIVKLILEKLNEDPLILAITFDADKSEDTEHHNSRQRSYRSMAAQLAKYLGWNYAITGDNGAEMYYVVCPQLSEEAIETILQRDRGWRGDAGEPPQIDRSLIDQLRGKMTEKFVTMQQVALTGRPSLLFSVYLNPDREEMRKYVARGARGFLTTDGDLYVEGYENIDNNEKSISQIDHRVFLEALQQQGIIENVKLAWRYLAKGGGIAVQRNNDADEIYIGESYEDDPREVKVPITKSKYVYDCFERAKIKNPNIKFLRKQITSAAGYEDLTNWDSVEAAERPPLFNEGISKKYYFKKGGPTRYQNTPNSFDDIEAGKAGPELAKGFDLSKREVRYLGPVVRHAAINDHLPSHLHEAQLVEITRLEDNEPYPYDMFQNQWSADIEGTNYAMQGAFTSLDVIAPEMFESVGEPDEESLDILNQYLPVSWEEVYNCFFVIVNKNDSSEIYQGGGDEVQKVPELVPLVGRVFATAIKVLRDHINKYNYISMVSYMSRSRKHLYQRLSKDIPNWRIYAEFDIGPLHFIVLGKDKNYEIKNSKMKQQKDPEGLMEFFQSIEEDAGGGVGLSGDFQAHAPEHMIGMNGVPTNNKGTGNTKHGKMDDRTWDSAYTRTRSEDYLRNPIQETRYERWPFKGNVYAEGYPSWVLYENGDAVAAIANDSEYEDDVTIRHMETKVKGQGYVEQLIETLLAQGVTISTGKANYNSISPSAYKLINRINEKEHIESKRIGPADNRGKGYKELEGVDVEHYRWRLK